MSLMDDIAAVGMETWFDTDLAAETVTYKGVSIPAHFIREDAEVLNASGRSERATLEVQAADVPTPANRDAVVVAGVTWYVHRIISSDGYSFLLELTRDERPVWKP
jgi:hypothetical protein